MAAREKVNPTGGVLGVVFWYEECSTCVSWFSCDPTTVYTGGGTECVFGVLFCISADEYCVWLSAVGKSVLMQLFVTDPVLGTVMLVSKLLMGWLLLRFGRNESDGCRCWMNVRRSWSLVK